MNYNKHRMAFVPGKDLINILLELVAEYGDLEKMKVMSENLVDFLDTLLICDNERKHSLSAVEACDPSREATRDMLIFFTRKPALPAQVSFAYDSLKEHPDYPLSFGLGV